MYVSLNAPSLFIFICFYSVKATAQQLVMQNDADDQAEGNDEAEKSEPKKFESDDLKRLGAILFGSGKIHPADFGW